MSSANRDSFYFFLFNLDAFSFLAWLLWQGLSVLYWTGVVRVSTCLILDLREKFQPITVEYHISSGLVIYGLYYVEVRFPLYPLSGVFLNHKWILNFYQKLFLNLLRWPMVFSLQFVNVLSHIDFWVVKIFCSPGINPTWSCCMILYMYHWNWFANILLRIFVFIFISDTVL